MSNISKYLPILIVIGSMFIITKSFNVFARTIAETEVKPVISSSTKEQDISNFLINLKTAINKDDRKAVAKLIKFPLKRCVLRKKIITLNKSEFLENYERIVTESVKREINEITMNDVYDAKIKGFSVPGGIWFDIYTHGINSKTEIKSVTA